MLHDYFVPTIPKSLRPSARFDRNKKGVGSSTAAENPSASVMSVKIGPTKGALNRIVATWVINTRNGVGALAYCQQDGGSKLTLISNKLVKELELEPYDQTSFRMETLSGSKLTHANLVKFDLQSLFLKEVFALSNVVINKSWKDDLDTLPHKQNMSDFSHFNYVKLLVIGFVDRK